MVYNAARLKDSGKDIAMEGAMAKLFSSQVAERVTSISLELFGGYGYTKDYPAEKFYRDGSGRWPRWCCSWPSASESTTGGNRASM